MVKMIFEFQLYSLLILTLLIIIYYSQEKKLKQSNTIFRAILLSGYISQLLYISTYIAIKNQIQSILFAKLYLIFITILFILFTAYTFTQLWQEKYKNEQTKLQKQTKKINLILGIITFISSIIILCSNIILKENLILYQKHIVTIFIYLTVAINFIILLLNTKKFNSNKYFHLIILFIAQISSIAFQSTSPNTPIINSLLVFMILYQYITLENINIKELEIVKLERDNAENQSLDKSSFLRTLSHEIRTPINTIDGYSQILLENNPNQEIQDDIQDIRTASKDLLNIINGMIDLSMIESGKLEIINENYNIYNMLDNVIQITSSKIRDKKIKLITKIEKDIPAVLLGDSERFSQIILNLLKNAMKHTDAGEITLEVESIKSQSVCRLKIKVKDTEKDITEEKLAHIFDNHEKNIDLLVARHLTNLMNGKIDVESTKEKEITITVTIDQKIISMTSKTSNQKKNVKPFKATGKRVIIADDNKLNLKVAAKLLEPYEVEVIPVNSGQECLDILEKDKKFDLILMDDLMPNMSGTETLDIIKKIERVDGYYIPIVVLTANAIAGMKDKYLNDGFEDYLAKPIDKSELDRILRKYLQGNDRNNEE